MVKSKHPVIVLFFAVSFLSACTLETDCEDGIDRCTNEGSIGKYETCSGGFWKDKGNCPNQYSCNVLGDFCGDCQNGATLCDNGTEKICADGSWGDNPEGSACREKICEGSPVLCINDDTLIGQIKVCNEGTYSLSSLCDNVSCNNNGVECGECLNGTKKCDNGRSYICKTGSWGSGTSCSYGCRKDKTACRSYGSDPN